MGEVVGQTEQEELEDIFNGMLSDLQETGKVSYMRRMEIDQLLNQGDPKKLTALFHLSQSYRGYRLQSGWNSASHIPMNLPVTNGFGMPKGFDLSRYAHLNNDVVLPQLDQLEQEINQALRKLPDHLLPQFTTKRV